MNRHAGAAALAVVVWMAVAVPRGLAEPGGQSGPLSSAFSVWDAHPAIDYSNRPSRDPVRELIRRIDGGSVRLTETGPSGFLRSVLDALDVPVESQIAVFSKDSLQASIIERDNPRALYFNDSVAVGWVRGGIIELASQDPEQGVMFYTLTSASDGSPKFNRREDCLICHYSTTTVGVPGMLVRSFGQMAVSHQLPLEERWGGWYVTGQHGTIHHQGNVPTGRIFQKTADGLNWPSLEGKVDLAGYLAPYSDIAALLVFEHQMHLMNLLTRINWEARITAYQKKPGAKPLAGTQTPGLVPLADGAKEVVDYLLFVDEAPFPDAIQGPTGFAEKFTARGPRDKKGRSLRDLDLRGRLLRYPLSYMIYSPQFAALPADAKNAIYTRLWQVLSGEDRSPRYAKLTRDDRAAIVEILFDTKPDLPKYFRPVS